MTDKTSITGLPARAAAHHLLQQITGDGRQLSELLGAGALDHLPPEDRARAQRLTVETLRGLSRLDSLTKPHLRKPPPLPVRNALRLGAMELVGGEAAHGVVNAYVEIIAKDAHAKKFKGLVNAVLRKIDPGMWGKMALPVMPKWLRQPLLAAWGQRAMAAMERAHFASAPLDLSAKNPEETARMTGGTLLPTGSVRLQDAGQVSALPGYADGAWWVQDAAAALPVKLLGDVTGKRTLDLCAAPGGKTLQLASGGADVTAVDLSEGRMARVSENLERTGLTATLLVADALEVAGTWDIVVLDAPCSATGTIRRHPDLPHAKDGSEFNDLIDLQSRLIDHAMTLVAPGGRLLFCTCSLLPDEGEVQVEEALGRHPEWHTDDKALDRPGVDPAWVTEEGGLRLRPDYWAEVGGMDGFYMAVLTKPA